MHTGRINFPVAYTRSIDAHICKVSPARLSRRQPIRCWKCVAQLGTVPREDPRLGGRYPCAFGSHLDVRRKVAEEEGMQLSDYMTLPVDQYVDLELPLGAYMEWLPEYANSNYMREGKFILVLPSLQFLTLEVKPTVQLGVRVVEGDDPCILITAQDASVEGEWADKLGINDKFEFQGSTRITWNAADESGSDASLFTTTEVVVGVDPPSPFDIIPISVLESAGGLVVDGITRILQDAFVRALADDYKKWATDADYRIMRAGVCNPNEVKAIADSSTYRTSSHEQTNHDN